MLFAVYFWNTGKVTVVSRSRTIRSAMFLTKQTQRHRPGTVRFTGYNISNEPGLRNIPRTPRLITCYWVYWGLNSTRPSMPVIRRYLLTTLFRTHSAVLYCWSSDDGQANFKNALTRGKMDIAP